MAKGLESNSFVRFLRQKASRVFAGISLGFYALAAVLSPRVRPSETRGSLAIDLKGHRGLRESI